jgi:hypothetical protein
MDDIRWDARGHQARRHRLFGSEPDGLLQERAFDSGHATGQLHPGHPVGHRFQPGRVMVEATDTRGVGSRHLGPNPTLILLANCPESLELIDLPWLTLTQIYRFNEFANSIPAFVESAHKY